MSGSESDDPDITTTKHVTFAKHHKKGARSWTQT